MADKGSPFIAVDPRACHNYPQHARLEDRSGSSLGLSHFPKPWAVRAGMS